AGTHPVQVAVEVKLKQIRRMIRRPPGVLGPGMGEAQRGEVESLDIGVDEARRSIVGDVIIQTGRKELDFGSIRAAQVAHDGANWDRRRGLCVQKKRRKVFTQSGKEAGTLF